MEGEEIQSGNTAHLQPTQDHWQHVVYTTPIIHILYMITVIMHVALVYQ